MGLKQKSPSSQDVSGGRTLAWLARSTEAALGDLDLSLAQYRLLAFLDHGEWAASVIAERLSVSRPSLTALADGLVAKGLVERRPSPDDRRLVLHVMTADGRKALRAADRAIGERVDGLLDRLEPNRRDDALAGLAALGEALDLLRSEHYGR